MLALARSERAHPRVGYRRATMEELEFPPDRFDLVVSSLALHYVEDYAGLMQRVGGWLAPGGVLVYSTEHPLYTASYPDLGWATDANGRQLYWTIDNYCVDGLREPHWFVDGVQKYHRSFGTLVNGLVDAGLVVEWLVEPVPTEEALQEHPTWVSELRRPTFLLVRARKP
jgi:SAM-dependent methyltransferase